MAGLNGPVGTVEIATITGVANMAGKDIPGLELAGDAVNTTIADSLPTLSTNPSLQNNSQDINHAMRASSANNALPAAQANDITLNASIPHSPDHTGRTK